MKTLIGYHEDDGDDSETPGPGGGGNEEPVEPPQVGQEVIITDGPFTDFEGVVENISQEKGKVRVSVDFFGRRTPVELDFSQVEKLKTEQSEDN